MSRRSGTSRSAIGLLGVVLLALAPLRALAEECAGSDIDDITTWDLFFESYTGEIHGIHGPGTIDARLYVPDSCESLPLVIHYHGNRNPPHGFDEQLDAVPNLVDQIAARGLYLLAPRFDKLADPNVFWTHDTVDASWRIVDEIVQLYDIDPDRIYVTGWSNGGVATVLSMRRHPERVAAAAPIATGPGNWLNQTGWWIETSYYIGELDSSYTDGSWGSSIQKQVDNGNDTVLQTTFPGLGHEAAVWNGTYGLDSLYTWMLGIVRYPCADGLDNDGDGWVDHVPDANGDGIGEYPGDPVCRSYRVAGEAAACQDGIDNDGDGTMDFDGGASWNGGTPPLWFDDHCLGEPWRRCERGSCSGGCGLGAELVLVVPFLWAWRIRRGARRVEA